MNTGTNRPALHSDAATGPHVPKGATANSVRRRPSPGSLVGGVVFAGADAEHASKSFSVLVGQRILPALDALQDRRRQLSIGSQLRLGEAAHDPPIAWAALLGGDEDNGVDRGPQNLHHGGEDVDLWCAAAGLPVMDGAQRGARQPGVGITEH